MINHVFWGRGGSYFDINLYGTSEISFTLWLFHASYGQSPSSMGKSSHIICEWAMMGHGFHSYVEQSEGHMILNPH